MVLQPEVLNLCVQMPISCSSHPCDLRMRSDPRQHLSMDLPPDVRELKQHILKSHPTKLLRFSIIRMRYIATPPVLIPKALNHQRAMRTLVSGKTVPLTMNMWENCKTKRNRLDLIHEYVTYR
ncbi:uncharacterized protein PHALS_15092 [Plasmopara halstedii]|uniref:Uncharacterized protein n=1 Tax=Plasmopara halstedii TaxID=4781 RepID=A0A0N7L7T5_PLAHL|nr:uncharacterized protein PHALS_15092 [Plasmopara halstedii]CEG47971.1 hypothetical protein PHALS_15092 [Plasmopara halstedii]|eukprot:XP_024584340.1 hypothetical protein PHALS_15092 [Plasmopara halstedii]